MASVTIEQVAPALRQLVKDDVAKLFEQEAPLYNAIKRNTSSDFVNGKGFRIPVYMNPPTGHTWFSEGGSFEVPGSFELKDMYVFPTAYALPMEFTGRFIRNFQDSSAMIKWLSGVLKLYTETAIKEIEEQLPGDGSGIKAVVASTATPSFTGTTAAAATFGQTKGTRWLRKGAIYDVIDPAAGTSRGDVVILTEGPTTVVTTAALPGGTTAGDYIVHNNGYQKAFRGLAHLINNGTDVLQLLSRADYPYLKSPVTDLAGATIGPASISKTKALLQYRSGNAEGSKSLTAVLSFGQYDILRRQGYNLRRFMNTDVVQGVASSYTDGDTTFLPNVTVDEDRCYLLDLSDIERYVEMDLGLYNLDGQTIRMNPGTNSVGSDKYYAAIGLSMNLGIQSPKNHALIKRAAISDSATETSAYA